MNSVRELIRGLKQLVTWWVVVPPWEEVVRVRWGKNISLLGPGVFLRIPFADRVYRQSTRIRTSDLRIQTTTTLDGHTVTCAGMIRYRIVDLVLLYQTLHHAEAVIQDMVAGAVAEKINTTNREGLSPERVRSYVVSAVDVSEYGLGDFDLALTDFAFVRTYRLIQDNRWNIGDDVLSTVRHEEVGRGQE